MILVINDDCRRDCLTDWRALSRVGFLVTFLLLTLLLTVPHLQFTIPGDDDDPVLEEPALTQPTLHLKLSSPCLPGYRAMYPNNRGPELMRGELRPGGVSDPHHRDAGEVSALVITLLGHNLLEKLELTENESQERRILQLDAG